MTVQITTRLALSLVLVCLAGSIPAGAEPEPVAPGSGPLVGETILFLAWPGDLNDGNNVFGWTSLRNHLNSSYSVFQDRFPSRPISLGDLNEYDAVVFGGYLTSGTLTAAEASNFETYVSGGGTLLVCGNWGGFLGGIVRNSVNNVGGHFGFSFRNTVFCDPDDHIGYNGGCTSSPGDPDNGMEYILLGRTLGHPVSSGVSRFLLNWGQSISVSGSAVPVVTGDSNSWADDNAEYTVSPPDCPDNYFFNTDDSWEPHGTSLVGVGAYENAAGGKVVAVGDADQWINFFLNSYDNRTLLTNVFTWFFDCEPPGVPNPVTASSNYCDRIRVMWLDVSGENGYRIFRDNWGSPIATVGANVSAYNDYGATAGPHQYRVSAYSNACGESDQSLIATGDRLMTPSTPSGISASTDRCDRIRVTWNNVAREDGFHVYRDIWGSPYATVGTDVTTYNDFGAGSGQQHQYRVAAFNVECGVSDQSFTVTGQRLTTPPVPGGVAASDDRCDRIRVTWNNVSGEDGYRIFRDSWSSPIGSVGANNTTYDDFGASSGSHNYRIVSYNDECGDSNQSSTAPGTRLTTPAVPGGVSATDNRCDRITVTWNNVSGEDGYQIFRDDWGAPAATVGPNVTSYQDLGVPIGPHLYRVAAFNNECGESDQSSTTEGERITVPAVPGNVAATTTLCDRITVSWGNVSGEDGYHVFRDGSQQPITTLSPNVLSYHDTSVPPGPHQYRVAAFDNICGDSDLSDPADGERLTPPATPGNVAASDDRCDRIRVTWGNVSGENGYHVFRDNWNTPIATVSANTTTYDDAGASPGSHNYRVTSFNIDCGDSNQSPTTGGTRLTTPAVPGGVSATDNRCDRITVSWNNVSGEDGYQIFRDDWGAPAAIVGPNVTSYQDLGVPIGPHLYRVAAFNNECGESDQSSTTEGERITVPAIPGNVAATTTLCDRITVSWGNVSGEDGYHVFRDGSQQPITTLSPNVLSYHDTSVPPGPHQYRVAAFDNTCGDSDLSDPADGERQAPPQPPDNVTATGDLCDRITVTWTDVSGEAGYRLFRDEAPDPIAMLATNVTAYEDLGATAGPHSYRVTAFNSLCGDSELSDPAGGERLTVPLPPANVTATRIYCDRVTVTWNAVAGVAGYRVFRDGAPPPIAELEPDVTTYDDTEASAGSHDYQITAYNVECGDSDPSEIARGVRPAAPIMPENVAATTTLCDRVTVSWSDVTGEAGYHVFRDTEEEPVGTLEPDVTLFDDIGVDAGSHDYRVTSFNLDCGDSPPSALATGVRLIAPAAPTQVVASTTACDRVALTWVDVAFEDGYRVYRDEEPAPIAVLEADVTGYDDIAASPGTHAYVVLAFNATCGDSPAPDPAVGERLTVPAAPGDVIASTDQCDRITITWTDVSGEDGYLIYRDGGSEPLAVVGPDVSILHDMNVLPGTHDYRVVAYNDACGESPTTPTVTGERLSAPATPADVTATNDLCDRITLTWGDVEGEDGFLVYRDSGEQPIVAVEADVTRFDDIAAPVGTHRYWVTAYNNACGESVDSPIAAGERLLMPGTPQEVAASTTLCEYITITWDDVDDEEGYHVYRDGSAVPLAQVGPGVTRHDDEEAVSGSRHTYEIAAYRAVCGDAPRSASVEGERLPGAPVAPAVLVASATECDRIILTWDDIAGEDGFDVYRDGDEVPIASLPANTTLFEDLRVTVGEHTYRVAAHNECGNAWTTDVRGERLDLPGLPVLSAPADGDSVSNVPGTALEWETVAGADRLQVQVAIDPEFADPEIDTTVETPSFALGDQLAGGQLYYWRVQAANVCGVGGFSPIWSFYLRPSPTLEVSDTEELAIIYDQLQMGIGTYCPESVVITNTGSRPTDWTVVPQAGWLSAEPAAGRLAIGGAETIGVCIETLIADELGGDSHTGALHFTSNGVLAETVDVPLIIIRYSSGDVTGDRVLDERDLAALLEHVLQVTSLSEIVLLRGLGDRNNDEEINVADLVSLSRAVAQGLVQGDGRPGRVVATPASLPALRLRFDRRTESPAARLVLEGSGAFRVVVVRCRWEEGAPPVRLEAAATGSFEAVVAQEGADMVVLFYSQETEPVQVTGGEVELGTLSWTGDADRSLEYLWGRAAATGKRSELIGGAASTGAVAPALLRPVLRPAHPNPLSRETRLVYELGAPLRVRLMVYDATGRHRRTLTDSAHDAGVYQTIWDGRDRAGRPLPAGVYFIRLETSLGTTTQRAVILR